LLTLATATLAIQKITEQSVKEEVMDSKEGTSYFSGSKFRKSLESVRAVGSPMFNYINQLC